MSVLTEALNIVNDIRDLGKKLDDLTHRKGNVTYSEFVKNLEAGQYTGGVAKSSAKASKRVKVATKKKSGTKSSGRVARGGSMKFKSLEQQMFFGTKRQREAAEDKLQRQHKLTGRTRRMIGRHVTSSPIRKSSTSRRSAPRVVKSKAKKSGGGSTSFDDITSILDEEAVDTDLFKDDVVKQAVGVGAGADPVGLIVRNPGGTLIIKKKSADKVKDKTVTNVGDIMAKGLTGDMSQFWSGLTPL